MLVDIPSSDVQLTFLINTFEKVSKLVSNEEYSLKDVESYCQQHPAPDMDGTTTFFYIRKLVSIAFPEKREYK